MMNSIVLQQLSEHLQKELHEFMDGYYFSANDVEKIMQEFLANNDIPVLGSGTILQDTGLTVDETKIMASLVAASDLYLRIPVQHDSEQRDFIDSIHRCQDLLAIRVARRCFPRGWPEKKRKKSDI